MKLNIPSRNPRRWRTVMIENGLHELLDSQSSNTSRHMASHHGHEVVVLQCGAGLVHQLNVGLSGRLLGAHRLLEVDVDAVQVVEAGVVDVVRHPFGPVGGVRHVRLQEVGCGRR